MKPRVLPFVLLGLAVPVASQAAVPPSFTVQGILRDGDGKLQSAVAHVTVSFYDASEAGNLVAGPYGPTEVSVDNGLFTVIIRAPELRQDIARAADGVWMEIVEGATLFPRQPISADLFALSSVSAETADALSAACNGCVADAMISALNAEKVQGKVQAAAFADQVQNGVYTNLQYFDPPWITGLDGAKVAGKVAEAFSADMAKSVWNGVYSNQTYANPDWIASLDGMKITGLLANAQMPGAQVVGKVPEASVAETALSVPNALYQTELYNDPAWLAGLSGAKILGPVGAAERVTGLFHGDVNGSQDAIKVLGLGGRPITTDDPSDGQVIRFEAATGQWKYSTLTANDLGGFTNQYVGVSGDQIIAGTKTFTSPIAGELLGNAASVTNGVYTNVGYVDPTFIVSLAGAKIQGKVATAALADHAMTVESGVYSNIAYNDPDFIVTLAGSKITGKIAAATLADHAMTVENGVYTNAAYNDPAFIAALSGAKIIGPVEDAKALGGLAASEYQRAMKNGCGPGTYIASVNALGEPVCTAATRSAFGSAAALEIEPDFKNTIAHLVIDVPGPGFIEATASYQVTVNNDDGLGAKACTAETLLANQMAVPAPMLGYQAVRVSALMNTNDGSGAFASFPGAVTTRIPVQQAGPVTLYLSGASDCPHAAWVNVGMNAIWHAGTDATIAFGLH